MAASSAALTSVVVQVCWHTNTFMVPTSTRRNVLLPSALPRVSNRRPRRPTRYVLPVMPTCPAEVRCSDKALLKQRVGTLVGWDLHDEEETPPTAQDHHLSYMPKCVYVQFYDEDVQGNRTPCTWTVGSLAPGVYPIDPDRQDWYVDGDKQNRVARRQFPLSPHFANTVYSSQGLTIATGMVDLKVCRYTDATTLYVAISRFRRADHLLILQPFGSEVLQQGEPAQAAFLL